MNRCVHGGISPPPNANHTVYSIFNLFFSTSSNIPDSEEGSGIGEDDSDFGGDSDRGFEGDSDRGSLSKKTYFLETTFPLAD